MDGVTRGDGILQRPQNDHTAALTKNRAIGLGTERHAIAVLREDSQISQLHKSIGVQNEVDPAHDGRPAFTRNQRPHGQMQCGSR